MPQVGETPSRTNIADPDTGLADPDTGGADPDTGGADPDTGVPNPDRGLPNPDRGLPNPDRGLPNPDRVEPIRTRGGAKSWTKFQPHQQPQPQRRTQLPDGALLLERRPEVPGDSRWCSGCVSHADLVCGSAIRDRRVRGSG
jgi:hypothetical protein